MLHGFSVFLGKLKRLMLIQNTKAIFVSLICNFVWHVVVFMAGFDAAYDASNIACNITIK